MLHALASFCRHLLKAHFLCVRRRGSFFVRAQEISALKCSVLEERAAMEEEAAAREQEWQWREREWKREREREREALRLEREREALGLDIARDMQMSRAQEREKKDEEKEKESAWELETALRDCRAGKEERGVVSGEGEEMGTAVKQASDRDVRQSADPGKQQGIGEMAVVHGKGSRDETRQSERESDATAGDCASGEGQQEATRHLRQQASETSGECSIDQHGEREQSPESGKAGRHIDALSADVVVACEVIDVMLMRSYQCRGS